ncbi:hypothetical protein COHA_001595 [Chlorella ohadii]|uniref:SRCR domain-containing protein n=1 Tax=Chlorella ohadii TaxID=2649997 RepID=A0AAD5DYS9_9CHLO|nr:hypothetical protein COHA_001595 [Chlorella ohadii]
MARRLSTAMALLAALVLASGNDASPLAALSPYALPPANSTLPGMSPAGCVKNEDFFKKLWDWWKNKYKKPNDLRRYGVFKKNVRNMPSCPYKGSPKLNNIYLDWRPDELTNHMRLWVPTSKPQDTIGPKNDGPVRKYWDWRKLRKVTPPKDQGLCGACWAFAAAAAIESKVLIQFNKTYPAYAVDLSEQQLIDCADPRPYSGCSGGNFQNPLAFASSVPLAKEDEYRYISGPSGLAQTCNTAQLPRSPNGDIVQLTGSGFKQLQPWSAVALREAVDIAPVLVGLHIPEGGLFERFTSGTWGTENCPPPRGDRNDTDAALKINHAVLVVGYQNITMPGHWIISEEEWGEDGYANIEMLPDGPGTCYMYYYMMTPTELVPTKLDPFGEPAKTSVRLVNKTSANASAGRLEIKHSGQWGTVCSDGFSDTAAGIVCRQLGRGTTGTAVRNAYFGEGTNKPRWLDEVGCSGSEGRLEQCAHAGWGVTNCGHKEDVGVICSTGPPCKAVGARGCTATGGTACCAFPGMACVIPKGSTSGTCTKPPTLTAMPVKGVSTVAVNKVVITTIQLAAKPVASINGGATTHYRTMLTVLGRTSPLYTVETAVVAEVVFREGVTALVGGGKLPAGGLCGRTFHVQFSARNGAGYSTVTTSTATYTMPDCPGGNSKGQSAGIPGLIGVVQVAAGAVHTCTVNNLGIVACWGGNEYGQRAVPRFMSALQLAAGDYHTCALISDGTVACWGHNGRGQSAVPKGLSGVIQVAAGAAHSCALKSNGTVACWGCRAMGASGCTITGDSVCCAGQGLSCVFSRGSTSGTCMKPPTLTAAPVKSVSAVITNKVVTATVQLASVPVASRNGGDLTYYRFMLTVLGRTSPLYTVETAVVPSFSFEEGVTALLGGGKIPAGGLCGRIFRVQFAVRNGAGYSAMATSTATYTMPACPGIATCWGANWLGQNIIPSNLPDIVQIAAGETHTCALQRNGTVTCWGSSDKGLVPAGLSGVIQLEAGSYHTCALQLNGAVVCWGAY